MNIGIAAHISAASPNGPRFNKELSSEERKSIKNGIWLCYNCSVLIDRDVERYTCSLLHKWKGETEAYISKQISGSFFDQTILNYSNNEELYQNEVTGHEFFTFFCSEEKGIWGELTIPEDETKFELLLNYHPIPSDWDSETSELGWNNPYHFTLKEFSKIINEYCDYHADEEVLLKLNEIQTIINKKGIEGLAEYVFDLRNKGLKIPKYSEFLEAIKAFFREKKDYIIQQSGHVFYVIIENEEYIITSQESKIAELNYILDNRLYDELYIMK
jgi:hypothetical protein